MSSPIYLLMIFLMFQLLQTNDSISFNDDFFFIKICYKGSTVCLLHSRQIPKKPAHVPKSLKHVKNVTSTNRGRKNKIFWKQRSVNRKDYMVQIKKDSERPDRATFSLFIPVKT
ncbi:PREDICTED: uncharacterized protein LOC106125741 [Papilio xuthus]|uniref:Uncharacterized protein LOC106125741 n=1 Tax=Papilio xuthus TaxID=66420 RepID=A0AAJ7EID2_PAPXU|nr:PREDICTED: uncharacterized protein LOC106125741 [Papilio xuthus]